MACLLAIDPGSDKVGWALVRFDGSLIEKGIVFLGDLPRLLRRLCPSPPCQAPLTLTPLPRGEGVEGAGFPVTDASTPSPRACGERAGGEGDSVRGPDELPEVIVLGGGTASEVVARLIRDLDLKIGIRIGDEKNTTYEARARYFRDHPPTGFWRLVPLGMQAPPCPVDDYAAWLIGERYLEAHDLQNPASDEKPD